MTFVHCGKLGTTVLDYLASTVLNTDWVLLTRSMTCGRQKGDRNHSPAAVLSQVDSVMSCAVAD